MSVVQLRTNTDNGLHFGLSKDLDNPFPFVFLLEKKINGKQEYLEIRLNNGTT